MCCYLPHVSYTLSHNLLNNTRQYDYFIFTDKKLKHRNDNWLAKGSVRDSRLVLLSLNPVFFLYLGNSLLLSV